MQQTGGTGVPEEEEMLQDAEDEDKLQKTWSTVAVPFHITSYHRLGHRDNTRLLIFGKESSRKLASWRMLECNFPGYS